ncbi:hypothetical protein HanRHA438_Chr16g0757951 [Helianthus annuus]|nr:hypothetical protein HanRHA438_Chr16g0757951 [Helianthus annuus]
MGRIRAVVMVVFRCLCIGDNGGASSGNNGVVVMMVLTVVVISLKHGGNRAVVMVVVQCLCVGDDGGESSDENGDGGGSVFLCARFPVIERENGGGDAQLERERGSDAFIYEIPFLPLP